MDMKMPLLEIKDTGIIRQLKKGIAQISSLDSAVNGQLIEMGAELYGLIIGFNKGQVLALVLGDETKLKIGDVIYGGEGVFDIPVGEEFIGRIVGAFSQPIDGKGKIKEDDSYPVFRDAPGVMDRIPINEPLYTGIKIIDTVVPLGKGQRELIIGNRITGKTSLAVDTILNQKGKGVICIFCWIGGSYSAFRKLIQELKREEAMDYLIVVAALASDSPAEQYIAPYAAAALGEYFMHRGRDVLTVFDNLTKHAWVYRQLSLLLGRPPGKEAYPGDIFYLHSQLLERAGKLNEESGGGSMTFLPIVETQEGDVTGIIPSNLISMTDGQIYLDVGLFNEGFRPAVDLGLTVSRIGSKVQCEAIKEVSGKLKGEYARYKELLSLTRVRTKLALEIEEKLNRGKALSDFFIQDKFKPLTLTEQIVVFYALKENIPEILEDKKREKFQKEIYRYLLKTQPQLIEELTAEKLLTDHIKNGLNKAFSEFFRTY